MIPDNLSLQTVVISGIQPENARTKYLGVQPQKCKLLFFRKNDGRNFGRILINCDTSRQRPQKFLRLQPGETHEKSIKSFVFYSDVRHKSTNYIVKVLFYENQDGFPKRKLPYEVVKELTPKDNGRVEVDVTGHGIVLPPEGLFIGLEFVGCSEYIEVPEPSKLKQNLKSYSFGAIRDYLVVFKDLDARSEKVYFINIDETGEEHRVQIPSGDRNNLRIPVFGLVVYE